MADRPADRAPSVSSSVTEADAYDDHEKMAGVSSLKDPEELEIGDDIESAGLLPLEQEKPEAKKSDNSARTAALWMIVNTLATIGIVSSGQVVVPAKRPLMNLPGLH